MATYLVVGLILLALHVGGWDIHRRLGAASTIVAFAWFTFLPLLVWRLNSCPSCKKRMKVDLLPNVKGTRVEASPPTDGHGRREASPPRSAGD